MIKAVIHIDYEDAERQLHGLGNVRNARQAADKPTDIEVVCHGFDISLLVREGNKNAGPSPNSSAKASALLPAITRWKAGRFQRATSSPE